VHYLQEPLFEFEIRGTLDKVRKFNGWVDEARAGLVNMVMICQF
jgi:hypothetical protein